MIENKKPGVGIGIMILKNGKVLLGKRHQEADKASSELHGEGTWTMPGGKLHFQESFEQGAIREVLEETGIKLKKIKVICVNNDKVDDAHFATIGLFSDDFEGEPQVKEPDEITEWNWFELENLPSPIYSPSLKVLENYKKGVFYLQDKLKREFISTVYIVKDKKILLTLNEKVNKWVPVGGHIDENELPCESVIREAKEETGFDIELINAKEKELGNIIQNVGINLDIIKPNHHHINIAYLAKIINGKEKSITDDNTELKWFSPQELKSLKEIPENVRASSLKAIEIIEGEK
jgi:8-oxo-dGTP diphosphatase